MIGIIIVILNFSLLILVFTAALVTPGKSFYLSRSINRKEHCLYLLYPLADRILRKTPLERLLKRKNSKLDTIKAIYTTIKAEDLQHLFWCSKIALVIVVLILFNILSLFSQLFGSSNSMLQRGRYLQRPEYGEGSTSAELGVTMEQTKGSGYKEEPESRDVTIRIGERNYTEIELYAIFEKCFQYLEKKMLGDNESADQIITDLNLVQKIPGYALTIDWEPEDEKLINLDGTVNNQGISKLGTDTDITVILACQEKEEKHRITLHIMPRVMSKEEVLFSQLSKEINIASENSLTDPFIRLPATLGDYHLSWKDRKSNFGSPLLLLGVFAAIAAWYLSDRELDLKMKKRKEQLLSDYPELINKFTLLVNAGMTIKQAWNRIAEDYLRLAGNMEKKKRYAYEEMLLTANEIKLGVSEHIAYEQYGRRIGLISYIKFSSLVTQNLRKGTKDFTDLMLREATEAFEERREVAKQLGEEAGTKLLIPMVVMLIIVFLIIMIPAFLSFRM